MTSFVYQLLQFQPDMWLEPAIQDLAFCWGFT
jgi:hypothetical protein